MRLLPSRRMALRIEYFHQGKRVMSVPCPKSLDQAKEDAVLGLARFEADTARIYDMDDKGREVARLTR